MKRKIRKMIDEHLDSMEESKKRLPKDYWGLDDIIIIRYGFMGRKTITTEMIKKRRKERI